MKIKNKTRALLRNNYLLKKKCSSKCPSPKRPDTVQGVYQFTSLMMYHIHTYIIAEIRTHIHADISF